MDIKLSCRIEEHFYDKLGVLGQFVIPAEDGC